MAFFHSEGAMNTIEEAAKRLEELKKAGIELFGKSKSEPAPRGNDKERPSPDSISPQISRTSQARLRTHALIDGPKDRGTEPTLSEDTDAAPNVQKIDFARLQAAGFITPTIPDSKLLAEFRVIKRPLIRNALDKSGARLKNSNLIMVTSSLPGEGKSFVSVNLALSIAMEVDSTVLLVDADVVAPTIPRLLGIKPARGLMDVLTEPDLNFGEVIMKTNINKLALVQAGTRHRGASELLASDAMARLLDEIASRYSDRIVIFDSPPLLATTESRVLASHMGQLVVVVEADRTTHATLEAALSTVESCPVVMTMLNKASESEVGSYYGNYGYGGGNTIGKRA
jgi:protein-tyrosine kinase